MSARGTLIEAGRPTLETIEGRLNAAGLCRPLTFDIRSVSGLLGFPIPSFIPIDTNLRWDQGRQSVKRFASSSSEVALDFDLGCQPSSNGAVLDYLGLTPEKLRLEDKVACTGDRRPDGELAGLVCKVEGRVGRFLAKNMLGLSDKVGRLLPMNLAVPANGEPESGEKTASGSADETGVGANPSPLGGERAEPADTAATVSKPTSGANAAPDRTSAAQATGETATKEPEEEAKQPAKAD